MLKVKLLAYTPEPEKVIAIAARICYSNKADIETIADGFSEEEVSKFIEQLISTNHACYDDQTEVLTEHGFKMWQDITTDDKLAVINPQTAAFQGFETPIQLHKYYVQDQDMLFLENEKFNFCVTDNHRLYMSLSYSQKQRAYPLFQIQQANEIIRYCKQQRGPLRHAWQFPMRMLRCSCNRNSVIHNRDCEYKLYGFFIGDGHCQAGNTLRFHLRLKRKIEYLTNICQECGYQLDTMANDIYVVRREGIADEYRKMFYHNGEKTFPDSFYSMSYNQFQNFLEGLNNSDGWSYGNGYDTTSVILRDKLIALLSINGFAATYSTGFKSQENEMWKDMYRIYYTSKFIMPHINDSRDPDSYIRKIKYSGFVYCATVSTGLLMVRRKGKTLISGNSVLEHSSFTFGIEGVSRAVLAEITRHRLASFSVRSQRYCSEGETEFICPDIIADSNEQVDEIFWSSVANSLGDYKDLLREEIPKEAARYVLPNATTTRMIVTMNARELRHFFALRCCRRALPEMQNLATFMLSEVKKVAPTLFKNAGASCVQLGYCPEGKRSCGLKPTLEKLKEGYRLAKNLERNSNGQ